MAVTLSCQTCKALFVPLSKDAKLCPNCTPKPAGYHCQVCGSLDREASKRFCKVCEGYGAPSHPVAPFIPPVREVNPNVCVVCKQDMTQPKVIGSYCTNCKR